MPKASVISPPHRNKILNPKTGRYVLKTGRIGRLLVDCPEGKIRNPQSKRCIKEDGRAGRRVLSGKSPIKAIPKKQLSENAKLLKELKKMKKNGEVSSELAYDAKKVLQEGKRASKKTSRLPISEEELERIDADIENRIKKIRRRKEVKNSPIDVEYDIDRTKRRLKKKLVVSDSDYDSDEPLAPVALKHSKLKLKDLILPKPPLPPTKARLKKREKERKKRLNKSREKHNLAELQKLLK